MVIAHTIQRVTREKPVKCKVEFQKELLTITLAFLQQQFNYFRYHLYVWFTGIVELSNVMARWW